MRFHAALMPSHQGEYSGTIGVVVCGPVLDFQHHGVSRGFKLNEAPEWSANGIPEVWETSGAPLRPIWEEVSPGCAVQRPRNFGRDWTICHNRRNRADGMPGTAARLERPGEQILQ